MEIDPGSQSSSGKDDIINQVGCYIGAEEKLGDQIIWNMPGQEVALWRNRSTDTKDEIRATKSCVHTESVGSYVETDALRPLRGDDRWGKGKPCHEAT